MNSISARIVSYFGIVMAAVYFAAGCFLIASKKGLPELPQTARMAFGAGLIAYGIFRFYRYRKSLQQQETEEEEHHE